jgi:beta-phosphoglucomutase-like phosphatase (HAD superfamily)
MDFIWGFNGTIMDTYPLLVKSLMQALLELHVDEFEIDDYAINLMMRRRSVSTCLQKYAAHFNLELNQLENCFKKYEQKNILDAHPILNIQKVLNTNNGRNFLLVQHDSMILHLLDKYKLTPCFDKIIIMSHQFKQESVLNTLSNLLKDYQIEKSNCLMISSQENYLKLIQLLSVKTCLFDPDSILKTSFKPSFIINNYYDLLQKQLFFK